MGPFKSSLLKHTDFVIDYHTLIYDLESFIFNCIQLFCCLCGIPRLSGCMFYPTISLVLKSDVVISRSGPKKLNINSAVIVEGIMSVKNLKINGQPSLVVNALTADGGGSLVFHIKDGYGSDYKDFSKSKIWDDGESCLTCFGIFEW